MRFSYTISYVPGKKLVVADALSRAPVSSSTHTDDEFQAEVEMFANTVVQSVPATEKRLRKPKRLMKFVRSYISIVRVGGHTDRALLVPFSHTFR